MTSIINLLKTNRGRAVFFAIVFLLLAVLIAVPVFLKKDQDNTLTQEEKTTTTLKTNKDVYKEAQTQKFPSATSNKTGSLIVTSVPSGARVIIDAPKAEAPTDYPFIPSNITPFKISNIPEGTFLYFATKDGYDFSEGKFVIKGGETTFVKIVLYPLE